jgi:23S rRNA pseudouridine2605 synthase/23S rRNA pseudouridine2604 synthase
MYDRIIFMSQVRIHKYLAQCGVASRRAAEKLIEEGVVCVNGLLAHIGDSIDPDKDRVTIKGKVVENKEQFVYIALNKPRGYICSCSKQQGPSILDIVAIKERVFPVGRLDKDSEGLVLLTNDGELANKLTHPRYGCEKEYMVGLSSDISDSQLDQIKKGVVLEDGHTKPCKAYKISPKEIGIIIAEGKNRQIRRMFQVFGKKVIKLKRLRIKNLKLGSLEKGKWIFLGAKDISLLLEDA